MKLSYTTLSVQDKSIEQAIEIATNSHLNGIEIRGKDNVHVSSDSSFSYILRLKKLIEKSNLEIPLLTAYTKFYQETKEKIFQEIDKLENMILLAEYLNAPLVRVFMGEIPSNLEKEKAEAIANAGLMYAAEKLKGTSVKLAIETHDSTQDGKTMKKVLSGIPEQIGVLLDIIHPWKMGESIEETWNNIGDRIYHVHIKDIKEYNQDGNIYSNIGEGLLPVAKTVNYLNSHGYKGYYSLEWEKSVDATQGVSFIDQLESFVLFMRRLEYNGNN